MIPFSTYYSVSSTISQIATRNPSHPLKTYSSLVLASEALAELAYRGDTVRALVDDVASGVGVPPPPLPDWLGGRQLDFLRHPTATQAAIDGAHGPGTFGDCEDAAGWMAGTWHKSALVDRWSVRLVYVRWQGERAHMCVEATKDGETLWASNWFRCRPRAGTADVGMREAVRSPLDEVIRWRVVVDDLDFLRLTPM